MAVSSKGNRHFLIVLWILLLFVLIWTADTNYLLFHSIIEIFCVIIAFGIFILAWNTRDIASDSYLLFLGISYLFVGVFDILHTLSYKGLNVFPEYDANLPTQLWIAARYIESLSLLISLFFINKRIKTGALVLFFIVLSGFLLYSIFKTGLFPDCFIEGSGLTLFKIISEYIISIVLITSLFILYRNRAGLEKTTYYWIVGAIGLTILSELTLTLYNNVFGASNLVGHLFKLISFFMIYKALIETGLKKPVKLLFRNLNQEIEQRKMAEEQKEKLIADLTSTLSQVKTLSGLLPICASCKKIRNDSGYWTQIEQYIQDRTDAEFSHGICPDCAKKLYPEFYKEK